MVFLRFDLVTLFVRDMTQFQTWPGFLEINILTIIYEDWIKIVPSRSYISKSRRMSGRPHVRRTMNTTVSQKLAINTSCSGQLKSRDANIHTLNAILSTLAFLIQIPMFLNLKHMCLLIFANFCFTQKTNG